LAPGSEIDHHDAEVPAMIETLLPAFIMESAARYNAVVILAAVALFACLLFAGAAAGVFLAFRIDTAMKRRGRNLEMALFAVILLLVLGVALAAFSVAVLFAVAHLRCG